MANESNKTKTVDVMVDETVIKVLGEIQQYMGDYYLRVIDKVCRQLIADSDMLSIESSETMDLLRGMQLIREDIRILAGIGIEPLSEIDDEFGEDDTDDEPDNSDDDSEMQYVQIDISNAKIETKTGKDALNEREKSMTSIPANDSILAHAKIK